jgi:hypothetical protein
VTRLARRLLRGVVYALLVANLATLWIVRDGYVNGWDFFGATYGVLALNAGSFAQGVHTILQSVLQQKGRVVRIPSEAERSIQVMANTDSDGSRTPVPTEAEH